MSTQLYVGFHKIHVHSQYNTLYSNVLFPDRRSVIEHYYRRTEEYYSSPVHCRESR
jgi:hypothetical protein